MSKDYVDEKEFEKFLQKNVEVKDFMMEMYPGNDDEKGFTKACDEFNDLVEYTKAKPFLNPSMIFWCLFVPATMGAGGATGSLVVGLLLAVPIAATPSGIAWLINKSFGLDTKKKEVFKEVKKISKQYHASDNYNKDRMKKYANAIGLKAVNN